MIDRIVIRPKSDRMALEMLGDLAGLLGKRNNAIGGLVAGAGFGRKHTAIEFLVAG
jgi:hypothetical protein